MLHKILSKLGIYKAKEPAPEIQVPSIPAPEESLTQPQLEVTLTVTKDGKHPSAFEDKIPTVRMRKELAEAFNEAFTYELKTISAFSEEEISEMLSIINNSEHGFPNMDAWVKPIYEKYFNREWTWPVYDDFIKWRGGEPNTNKFEIFEQLVDYIHGKANSIDKINFHKKYGGWISDAGEEEKIGIDFHGELAEEYGSIILKNNPDALPPFYPGDISCLTDMDIILKGKELKRKRTIIFENTFKNIMNSLNSFSGEEINSMLDIINSVYDKHKNDFSWSPKVYEEFFENREWTWPLYEEWLIIKRELDGDTKKRRRSPKKTIFKILVRYIILTASRTETIQEAQKSGNTLKIRHHDAEEEKYANYFLKRNPDAMPPFYPGNESWLERIFS